MIGKWNIKSQQLPRSSSVLLGRIRNVEEKFVLDKTADVIIENAKVIPSATISRMKMNGSERKGSQKSLTL